MIECSVNNLIKYYGANKVFENISFELHSNERVGLIGQNGCGKTTLMKVLMGVEDYHGGNISFRKGNRVGYLDQIFKCSNDTTVIEILEMPFESIFNIKLELKAFEERLKNLSGEALEIEMKNYGLLMEEFERCGGYDIETNINKVCSGLFIPDSFREKTFEGLSGGEKTRVLLARLLLENPDILLLDEPTNHLDIKSIEWLEEFLLGYNGTVLMVSHDRSFLDKVANRIIELEPTATKIYDGNYSYYIVEKERRFELEYNAYINNQRKIEKMEQQIERYRIWGAMRDSEKMYKRAKELEKRLEKVEVLDRPTLENSKIRLSADNVSRSGKIVLNVENLSKCFSNKKLFSDISFTLFYQDKLCIMGENGSGKTTLLKIILGELEPDSGNLTIGSSIKLGYLPQNVVFENEDMTILDYFAAKHSINQLDARSELAKMLFIRDDVHKKIKSLSGGEKSRLKLCSLIFDKVNFMILDEPTNHLDIDSREVLEETLSNFNGTILFVSHDRYFVQKVAIKIMILDKSGVRLYPMTYDEYLEVRKKEITEKIAIKELKPIKTQPIKTTRKPNNAFKIAKAEEEIEELESKLKFINEEMALNSDNADRLYELFVEKESIEKQLEDSYELWETLNT
ncbi:ribosomal protection-like ABC-F family protein [uncultured Tissierella sp.]|jgi:ATP-binding cassette subfamily F protein 3|uniref:ribosomal protection-like ABC-F family protein n=1 Tax=uncultured Tissierella sp. TaxID=448160 RepID=UPI002805691E|nr:ABC-F type ribosomal protection protein [uncultured Tissierella sp.]MDU5080935.1 ABC-F type ribosomal protection protein [Bacillota bacterium]